MTPPRPTTEEGRHHRYRLTCVDCGAGIDMDDRADQKNGKLRREGWHYPACWRAWSTAWHPEEWPCICANLDTPEATR